jgi:Castor and Pollux, part of voltage-gated ion channel/Calcium-activated potassium channel slowpoke-like RCK domain
LTARFVENKPEASKGGAIMGTSRASVGSKIRYAIDNFMARGGFSVFLAVLTMFAAGFIAMSVFRIIGGFISPDETAVTIGDGIWRTFLEIADGGNVGEDSDAPYLSKFIGIITIFVGMILFSSMVAFITSQFESKLESMRRGRSKVIESGHSLILGFGDRVLDIIRELIEANESERDAAVVILADRDKQEMDDLLNERIADRRTTRLVTRTGVPSNMTALKRVCAEGARSITILSEARSGDANEEKALADARVLKTIMAVIAAVGETEIPPIVAELHWEKNRSLASSIVEGRITTLAEDSLLAKMLVQTSCVSGLALVYSDLVGFEGNEVYFFRPDGGWPQVTFGQLQHHFLESVPLGIRQASGAIALNPPPSRALRPDDDIIVLAEDDSTIGYSPAPVFEPRELPLSQLRHEPTPSRQLLVGWTSKSSLIIDEFAQYLKDGSAIHTVIEHITPEIRAEVEAIDEKYPGVEISVSEIDVTAPDTFQELVPHTYANVIILSSDIVTPEEADATTVAMLLRFRQYFRAREKATGEPTTTQTITEVMDSENIELVLQVGVKDYLISNQFVSKIFAQVAQEPDVMRVYDDLFQEEGSEIYIKPVELYFSQLPISLRFGDCVAAAQARGEVCFGYNVSSEKSGADKTHGIHILPRKDEQITLNAGDRLIALAEDES